MAVLAKENGVPFYVAAPLSTLDLTLASGGQIPIEQRAASEVTEVFGVPVAPEGIAVQNPVFDVTPARYVTAIITEKGVAGGPVRGVPASSGRTTLIPNSRRSCRSGVRIRTQYCPGGVARSVSAARPAAAGLALPHTTYLLRPPIPGDRPAGPAGLAYRAADTGDYPRARWR